MSATKLSAPEKTVPPRPLAPSLGAKPLPALFPPTLLAGVALVAAGLLYALGWCPQVRDHVGHGERYTAAAELDHFDLETLVAHPRSLALARGGRSASRSLVYGRFGEHEVDRASIDRGES